MKLETTLKLSKALTQKSNLTDMFTDKDLGEIGAAVYQGFEQDDDSRSEWMRRYELAMDLALQIPKQKTFPWVGASNVKFPLITIAALQWHSRAYPTLVSGTDIVKCRVQGKDADGKKHERAERVGKFMSWQVMEEDEAWEEETDRALIQLPIIGCVFKKSRRHATKGINISETVSAKDFVLNYYSTSVETSSRKTHIIPMHRNTMLERMRLGAFHDYEDQQWLSAAPGQITPSDHTHSDRRTGMAPPALDPQVPFQTLEQHVLMDLDGDGYAEPYIITIEYGSKSVLRIVTGFEWQDVKMVGDKVISIAQQQYFTKYSFIPSPDGGIYDMGFGALLGPLNASVDTIINQLIDAGTLLAASGGFVGKGVKIRGGDQRVDPFKWNRVDCTGDDLTKGLVPFPLREPPTVLFQLLGLLIDYTNRISGSTDIMTGENPGQNTPAATSQMMVEQGAKINTAIFKRVWRGMKNEFVKLYSMNRVYMPAEVYFGDGGWATREDFTGNPENVRPAADPNLVSDGTRMQQASFVAQRSSQTAGYDREVVERNLLKAMKIEEIDTIYPGAKKMPAPPPLKVMLEQMKDQREMGKLQVRMHEKMLELASTRDKNAADIELIKAQIVEILATIGAAKGAQQLKLFETLLKARENEDQHLIAQLKLYEQMSQGNGQSGDPQSGGVHPMAPSSGNGSGAAGPQPSGPGGLG